jgi:hypothetical protein
MAYIPEQLRQQVIERAQSRCEYCQTQQVIVWSEDGLYVIGVSLIGRVTIARLKMNREAVVNARRRWVKAGWHPPNSRK